MVEGFPALVCLQISVHTEKPKAARRHALALGFGGSSICGVCGEGLPFVEECGGLWSLLGGLVLIGNINHRQGVTCGVLFVTTAF